MTLARLQRAHYNYGSIQANTVVICDECSLNTLEDWTMLCNLRQLGCTIWCCGDMENQLEPINSTWAGEEVRDFADVVKTTCDFKRLTLYEGHRADTRLFSWLSDLAYGWLKELPLEALLAEARREFPAKG